MSSLRFCIVFLSFLFLHAFLYQHHAKAQKQLFYSASDILQDLQKLKVNGAVLYIAAHPDDENTRLLTYFSKEKKYRTAYLSLTQGEGGQNLIGEEQGSALGRIRKEELLAARRIDGAEQFFTSAEDFGYSKNKEETLQKWDKQKVLEQIVRVIRSFRPHIIITRFPPDKRAGHGHHAASAYLAAEAFDLAADSTVFTHHFKEGLTPWYTTSLFWNTYNFGSANTIAADQMKIDVGGFNPLLGKSYGEIAAESRSQHKSQGFGSASQRGTQWEYFSYVKGDSSLRRNDENSFIKKQSSNYHSVINKKIDDIIAKYKPYNPSASVRNLITLYGLFKQHDTDTFKLSLIRQIIIKAAGMYTEAFTNKEYAVSGDSLQINTGILNRSNLNIKLQSVTLSGSGEMKHYNYQNLPYNLNFRDTFFWLTPRNNINIDQEKLFLQFELLVEDLPLTIIEYVKYKFTDPVKGEIVWPLNIYPEFSLQSEHKVCLVEEDSLEIQLTFQIKKFSDRKLASEIGRIYAKNSIGDYLIKVFSLDTILNKDGIIKVSVSSRSIKGITSFYINIGDHIYDHSIQKIKYDHIPVIVLSEKVSILFTEIDCKTKGKKIGYIDGAGDWVDDAVRLMGYQVDLLDRSHITAENLKKYDAVITGIRAYNIHEWLADKHTEFMKYIDNGGVVLIQYNTSSQIGPLKNNKWLFPFTISRNRVSEEDAKVTFLESKHAVLNYPNKITQHDFDFWVQERSVYEADSIAASCKPILSMQDKGEPERIGSLVLEERGKGRLIYSGLTFFRQLPAGVTGAFRLLANLLSKPEMN